MKKYLLMLLAFAVIVPQGCNKEEKNGDAEIIGVSLTVTNIENNQATINVELTQGNFYGAMLVEAARMRDVDIDYTNQIKLIQYVRENGFDIDIPYSHTLTGLRAETEMFTAVIVFDANGVVTSYEGSDYSVWTVVGELEGLSEDNGAGVLDEDVWDEEDGGDNPDNPDTPYEPNPDAPDFGGSPGGLGEELWPNDDGSDGDGDTSDEPDEPDEPDAPNWGGTPGDLGEEIWPTEDDSDDGEGGGGDSGGGSGAGNLGEEIWPTEDDPDGGN